MGPKGWIGVALVMVGLGLATGGRTQEAPRPTVPASQGAWTGDWKAGVEAGQVQESVSGEAFVVAAYGALWLILFLFVLRLASLNAANRRELAGLKQLLDRHLQEGPTPRR